MVYPVQGEDRVVKIYHDLNHLNLKKLEVMLAQPPKDPLAKQGQTSIAWPTALIERKGTVCGFSMPAIEKADSLYSFINPDLRRRRHGQFHYGYLHRLAYNLSAAVEAAHDQGHVICDINTQNALATDRGLVTLIDCDSWQIQGPNRSRPYICPVGRPDFTPPEHLKTSSSKAVRTRSHDRFGLGVLLFMLLMEGHHPFAGCYLRSGDPPHLQTRIAQGAWPYSTATRAYKPRPSSPPIGMLAPPLQRLFTACFWEGHRSPSKRPTARQWASALREAEKSLTRCARQPRHHYSSHLSSCPWCRYAVQIEKDPYPSASRSGQGRGSPEGQPRGQSPGQQRTGAKRGRQNGGASTQTRGNRTVSIPSLPSIPNLYILGGSSLPSSFSSPNSRTFNGRTTPIASPSNLEGLVSPSPTLKVAAPSATSLTQKSTPLFGKVPSLFRT